MLLGFTRTPHFGQVFASELTSEPHSLQAISDIFNPRLIHSSVVNLRGQDDLQIPPNPVQLFQVQLNHHTGAELTLHEFQHLDAVRHVVKQYQNLMLFFFHW